MINFDPPVYNTMTKLGSHSTKKNYRAWETQRILNAAPEWAKVRSFPCSVGNQILNPIGCSIQETVQQLYRERYNMFLSLADPNQIDTLYRVDLPKNVNFYYNETAHDTRDYIPPKVYVTIEGTEYEISQAQDNKLEFLQFALPSRISYAQEFVPYTEVLSETLISEIDFATINNPSLSGFLYVTISDNTNWQIEVADTIYYNKIYITGTTRKGIKETEAIPARYNGTFKTNKEWKEIEEISGSYFSPGAKISISCFNTNNFLDTRNIYVSSSGIEKQQFLVLGEDEWGDSVFRAEVFAANDMDSVRRGMEEKDFVYKLTIQDSGGSYITLSSAVLWPNTDWLIGIDDTKLYVYDVKLPYNDCKELYDSPNSKFDLCSDRHFVDYGDTVEIKTRNLTINNPPYSTRWTIKDPSGSSYYIEQDGTWTPITGDVWYENLEYEGNQWREQSREILIEDNGLFIVSFEARYLNEDTMNSYTLTSKTFVFSPAIKPEVELNLPSNLTYSDKIVIDSDSNLWILKDSNLYKLDVFFDYFLADYESNIIWLREKYDSVRVDLNSQEPPPIWWEI